MTVGILNFASSSPISKFNGGKSQINLFNVSSGEFPFLNLIKTATAPTYFGGSFSFSGVRPDRLDVNGYPTTTGAEGGGYSVSFLIPPTTLRGGSYTVSWTGGDAGTSLAGPNGSTGSGANGTFTFTPTANPQPTTVTLIIGTISTSSSNYITSLSVVYTSFLALYNAGEILDPQFKQVMKQANFGVIRFLNWMNSGGQTNIALWNSRRGGASSNPANFITYADQEYRSAYWAGSASTANGYDYAVSGSAPSHGSTIQLQWGSNSTYTAASVTWTTGTSSTAGVNWTNSFVGNEPVSFNFVDVGGGADPPSGIWTGQNYYIVNNGLLSSSFAQLSLTPGGAAIAIGAGAAGRQVGARMITLNVGSTGVVPVRNPFGNPTTYSLQTISSGSYNSTTGVITLSLSANASFFVNDSITIAAITGTGTNLNQLKNTWGVASVSGSTVTLNASTGLGSITITGGSLTQPNSTGPLTIINGVGSQPLWATAVYDADLQSWLINGGNQNNAYGGIINGAPYEVMVAVCAELGAHPWFTGNMMALDPVTDFYPSLAAYMIANKPSWMIEQYETPNECWNSQFWQTFYAWNKSWIHWGVQFGATATFNQNDWKNKTASTLGQAINAAYGNRSNDSTKYRVTCGLWTGGVYLFGTSSQSDCVNGTLYPTQSQAAQAGYTKDAAYKWITDVCIANYFNPNEQGTLIGQPATFGTLVGGSGYTNGSYNRITATGGTGSGLNLAIVVSGNVVTAVSISNFSQGGYQLAGSGYTVGDTLSASFGGGIGFSVKVATLLTANEQADNATLLANGSQFTGKIIGTALTVDAVNWGTVVTGPITDPYSLLTPGTAIVSGSGTSWVVNNSQTVLDGTVFTNLNATASAVINSYTDSSANTTAATNGISLFSLGTPTTGTYALTFGLANGLTNNSGFTLRMCGYEGCFSPDSAGAGNPQIRNMAPLSADVGKLLTGGTLISGSTVIGTYNDFVTQGGIFPSQFLVAANGFYPNNFPWACLQPDIFVSPQQSEFLAIATYNT